MPNWRVDIYGADWLESWALDLDELIEVLEARPGDNRATTEALQNARNLRDWLLELLDDLRSVEDGQA